MAGDILQRRGKDKNEIIRFAVEIHATGNNVV